MIFLIEGAFAKGQQRKGRPVPDLIRGVGFLTRCVFPWPANSDFSRPAIVEAGASLKIPHPVYPSFTTLLHAL